MTRSWFQIWNQRGLAPDTPRDLHELLKVDGYDSGAGLWAAKDFREYVRIIASRLEMSNNGASVYEVGCGAGAFLFALRERISMRIVGGCDYAASLIDIAQQVFVGGDFSVAEAANVCTERKYDIVLANSVFHYFSDLDYATCVLDRMIKKANYIIAILELPNSATRMQAERVRREQLTAEIYEAKYSGLEHLYYRPSWFGKIAAKHDCTCEYFQWVMPNYVQSRFRFNVVIRKKV